MPFRGSRDASRRARAGVDVTLIVHHFELDRFTKFIEDDFTGPLLILGLLAQLRQRGSVRHVHISSGAGPRESDVAILHVNATVVSREYTDFAATFARCVNRRVSDISKRTISTQLAGPGTIGPVIAKSNLNYYGHPERLLNARAARQGQPVPFPDAVVTKEYAVYPSFGDVPATVLEDEHLIVEKYVPERSGDGYALRHWVFCGDEGYSNRYVSPEPIIKGSNVTSSEPVPVPDELRQWRRDHGLEYGKMDFVVHDDQALLLDANKTPGRIPSSTGDASRRLTLLADGLEALITGEAT